MTLMEMTMIPLDKGESFSKFVAGTLEIIDNSGLDYVLTPMGTIVEGEWSDLLALVDNCFNNLKKDANRISLTVKFDYRKGKTNRLKTKVESVQQKLGRTLRTV
ncbi:MAG: MTH1187 family thiamine-binding protein [Myxococcota bacterium]|nr:MTH1187 family thiamine-binding protein [Myxococcota bacterium]